MHISPLFCTRNYTKFVLFKVKTIICFPNASLKSAYFLRTYSIHRKPFDNMRIHESQNRRWFAFACPEARHNDRLVWTLVQECVFKSNIRSSINSSTATYGADWVDEAMYSRVRHTQRATGNHVLHFTYHILCVYIVYVVKTHGKFMSESGSSKSWAA